MKGLRDLQRRADERRSGDTTALEGHVSGAVTRYRTYVASGAFEFLPDHGLLLWDDIYEAMRRLLHRMGHVSHGVRDARSKINWIRGGPDGD